MVQHLRHRETTHLQSEPVQRLKHAPLKISSCNKKTGQLGDGPLIRLLRNTLLTRSDVSLEELYLISTHFVLFLQSENEHSILPEKNQAHQVHGGPKKIIEIMIFFTKSSNRFSLPSLAGSLVLTITQQTKRNCLVNYLSVTLW